MAKKGIDSNKVLYGALAFVGLAIIFWGYALLLNAPQHRSLITVSADGSVIALPSEATVYIDLNATGNSTSGAVANLSRITGLLNSTLMPYLDYNKSMMQTLSYNVYTPANCSNYTVYYYPVKYCVLPGEQQFYVASEYLSITIPNVSNVDKVLAMVANLPGATIYDAAGKLSYNQLSTMNQQALALALTNATSQAGSLSGGRMLQVENISVQNSYIYYPYSYSASSAVQQKGAPTFFPGTATVTKSIFVVFSVH